MVLVVTSSPIALYGLVYSPVASGGWGWGLEPPPPTKGLSPLPPKPMLPSIFMAFNKTLPVTLHCTVCTHPMLCRNSYAYRSQFSDSYTHVIYRLAECRHSSFTSAVTHVEFMSYAEVRLRVSFCVTFFQPQIASLAAVEPERAGSKSKKIR